MKKLKKKERGKTIKKKSILTTKYEQYYKYNIDTKIEQQQQ